ncbi:hypothetical protein ACFLTT_01690 [Chloroflexota bacterium]
MKPRVKTTLYFPEELHIAAKIEAAKRRIPLTKLIILGVEHELKNSKDYPKEQ